MSTPRPGLQTAAERREAEAVLRGLIDKYAPAHARLVTAVRKWLQARLPTAHEVVYEYNGFFVVSFSPSGRGFEGVLAIRGSADGVQFYFNRGKELPDPEKLLKGSASLVRFINLENAYTLDSPAVASLIEEAIARNPVPFALKGKGSVILQSIATNKSPRTGPANRKTASAKVPGKSKTARPKAASRKKSG